MKTPTRIAWHDGNVLHVIRLGKTLPELMPKEYGNEDIPFS